MYRYTSTSEFRRACALSARTEGTSLRPHVIEAWTVMWEWLFRKPLVRLVQLASYTLEECRHLEPDVARARMHAELAALPETDSLHTVINDIAPIRDIFTDDDADPEAFQHSLKILIATFNRPEVCDEPVKPDPCTSGQ